jgi:hypothetical protein
MVRIGMGLKDEFEAVNLPRLNEFKKVLPRPIAFRKMTIDEDPAVAGKTDENRVTVPARQKVNLNIWRFRIRVVR